jgi:hypothetical protein
MNPGKSTEAFQVLRAVAQDSEVKYRIRRHAAGSHAKLDLILSLMAYGGNIPLRSDTTDRFEAYLCLRTPEYLRDLLALLDVPEAEPPAPELQRAA